MVNGSEVGVAAAAKITTPTTATRQPRSIRWALRMPSRLSPTRKTGNRKPRPKTMMKRITKEKYIEVC